MGVGAGGALSRPEQCLGLSASQGGPVEILPFLYLGSAYHASRKDMLDALGITALINVSANCPNHFEGHYQYKSIPVEDNHKADISSWFSEAIDFIGEWDGRPALLMPPRFNLSGRGLGCCSCEPSTRHELSISGGHHPCRMRT